MLICSNCGSTNSEENGNICRKCGALLPLSKGTRRRRIELPSNDDDEIKILSTQKENSRNNRNFENNIPVELHNNPEAQIFHSHNKTRNSVENQLELQEIPLSGDISIGSIQNNSTNKISSDVNFSTQETLTTERPVIKQLPNEKTISLPEIKPQPYQGSILSSSPSIIKPESSSSNLNNNSSIPKIKPLPKNGASNVIRTNQNAQEIIQPRIEKTIDGEAAKHSEKKQKQLDLEQDMIEVLKFLSKKLSLPKSEIKASKKDEIEEEFEEKIQPSSLNEILKSLLTLNRYIEAATLLKTDGTILAAAISTRIPDSLLSTIGQNLAMIGTDIIHGLSAGDLHSISVRGTEGILDVAPLNRNSPLLKDMILMIFSDPKAGSGATLFAIKQVEKLIMNFFNIK